MTNIEISDRTLFQAWAEGDKAAGAKLFSRHYRSVARFFANKLGPDSDDLIQMTFLGCVEARERFRGEASFRTFLFAIARNTLHKHLREKIRDRVRFDPEVSTLNDFSPSALTLLDVRAEQLLLLAGLRRLPVDWQLLLELHYWEQLPIREMALVLDMPTGTVKTHMSRARSRLELELAKLAESAQLLDSTINGLEQWAQELQHQLR